MPPAQIGVRITADLWKQFKIEAIKRDLPPNKAVTEALENWLKNK